MGALQKNYLGRGVYPGIPALTTQKGFPKEDPAELYERLIFLYTATPMTMITRGSLIWIFTLSLSFLFFSPSDAFSQLDKQVDKQEINSSTGYQEYFSTLRTQGLVVRWSADKKRIYVKESKWNRLLFYKKKDFTQKHKQWYELSRTRHHTASSEVKEYFSGNEGVGVYGENSGRQLARITRMGFKIY